MENFGSPEKRSIKGLFIAVKPFHSFRYLDERSFRFNKREATDAEHFQQVLRRTLRKRTRYNSVIGDDGQWADTEGCAA